MSKNIQVAIADDHSLLRSALAKLINTFEGYNVIMEADNGKDLIEKINKNILPDIVLLDINMPEMDGFEIYAKLQANADTKDIPVMLVTAWADERNIERASQMGIQHFLPKPFTEDELLYTILTLLVDSSRKESR